MALYGRRATRRLLIVPLVLIGLVGAGCATGQTGGPGQIEAHRAVAGGSVLTNAGGSVEYWVEYGPTRAYGSETDHATVTVQKNGAQAVQVPLSGLTRSTRYHFRLCASDDQQQGGPGCGDDATLTTLDIDCGETITESVRFHSDVICPAESTAGLVVGADGVDINLAGRSLGMSIGSGVGAPAIVNDGHADVTIRNGSLLGGNTIDLTDATRNAMRNLTVDGIGNAIQIVGGSDNVVSASRADGRASGVAATNSDGLAVTNSDVVAELAPGMSVSGTGARISYNRLHLDTFHGPLTALTLTGNGNRVAHNLIDGQWGGGIVLSSGANNSLVDNEVDDTQLLTAQAQSGDGIFVGPFTAGTVLRDNLTRGNDGDGIEAQGSDARVGGNQAFSNGDFGIDAAAGVTDLGGNQASGNGNPLQCRNVFCS